MNTMRITHDDFPGVTLVAVPEISNSCLHCVFQDYPGTGHCPREARSLSGFACEERPLLEFVCAVHSAVWIEDTPEARAAYVAERLTS